MNAPRDQDLIELFADDEPALVDGAFFKRCVGTIQRENRRVLLARIAATCAAAGLFALVAPWLGESANLMPEFLSVAPRALNGTYDLVFQGAAIAGIVIVVVRRYWYLWFQLLNLAP